MNKKSLNILKLLRELINSVNGKTTIQIARKYDVSTRTVKRYLKDFRSAGFDVREIRDSVTRPARWKINF